MSSEIPKRIERHPNDLTVPQPSTQEALDAALKLGRMWAGWDDILPMGLKPIPKSDVIKPLSEVRYQTALDALARNNGNRTATSHELDITHETLLRILDRQGKRLPKPRRDSKIIHLSQVAAVMLCLFLTGCVTKHTVSPKSKVQSPIPPPLPTDIQRSTLLPRMTATVPAPVKTNGVVSLRWNNGSADDSTIANLTTGDAFPAGQNESITIGGLRVGVAQVFVATNVLGASNLVTNTPVADTNRLTLEPYISRGRWPGAAGVLQFSTNLVNWTDIGVINSGGTFLVTNGVALRGFYRVKL
jgi:hypothetical protein